MSNHRINRHRLCFGCYSQAIFGSCLVMCLIGFVMLSCHMEKLLGSVFYAVFLKNKQTPKYRNKSCLCVFVLVN